MRIAIGAAALAGCLLAPICSEAQAIQPYRSSYVYSAFDAGALFARGSSASTFTAGVGYQLNRYYAIEAGYEGVYVDNVTANGGYVDGYGYLPLGRHSKVALFSTVGASYIDSVYIGSYGFAASAVGVRAGGGIKWQFTDKWAMRATVRYESTITSAAVATLGFTVRF
jgi:hypothetical protein